MKILNSVLFLSIAVAFSACSKESVTKSNFDSGSVGTNPTQIKNIDLNQSQPVINASVKPIENGIEASILANSKEIALHDFARTLESTNLTLKIKAIDSKILDEDTTFTLLGQGYLIDSVKVNLKTNQNTLQLNFRTPRLSAQGIEDGVESVAYELLISNTKRDTHLPFSIKIYNGKNSTLIIPRDVSCSIYYKPEPASGCLQNRTRTTQELVFNNSVTVGSDSNFTYSGGINLTIGVVAAQFGAQKSNTTSHSTSDSAEIHFTNCIECSSIVFRQKVETIR